MPTPTISDFLRDTLGIEGADIARETTGGKDNITTLVTLPSGERIVIQMMRSVRDDTHARYIAEVLDTVAHSPYPIRVAPVWGERRFFCYGGVYLQVMGVLPGRIATPADYSESLVLKHAEALAYFHLATEDFDTRGYEGVDYHRRLPDFRRMATRYASESTDTTVREIFGALESCYPDTTDLPDLPRGVIWGDPVFKNCMIDGTGNIVGLIDYDMMSVTVRLWDLADFARGYLKVPEFGRETIDRYLAAYARIRPLSDAELRAYPTYLTMMVLDTGYRYFLSLFPDSGYYNELGGSVEKTKRCIREVSLVKSFFA